MMIAISASPAIRPDASGIPIDSARCLSIRVHTLMRMPPSTIVNTTKPGTIMPMPRPVAEGNRVVDIFYVTELDESKLASHSRIEQVKSQLAAALQRPLDSV